MRQELDGLDEESIINEGANQKLNDRLGSFIKESLRMRGDLLGISRLSQRESKLGKYFIPKGMFVYFLTGGSEDTFSRICDALIYFPA